MQQTKDSKDNKVRVFALARTLGMDSKALIDLCRVMGFDVKSQLASLEPEQVDALKARLTKGPKAAGPVVAETKPAPVAIPPKDRKIVHLPPAAKGRTDNRPEVEPPPVEVVVPKAPEPVEPPPAPVLEAPKPPRIAPLIPEPPAAPVVVAEPEPVVSEIEAPTPVLTPEPVPAPVNPPTPVPEIVEPVIAATAPPPPAPVQAPVVPPQQPAAPTIPTASRPGIVNLNRPTNTGRPKILDNRPKPPIIAPPSRPVGPTPSTPPPTTARGPATTGATGPAPRVGQGPGAPPRIGAQPPSGPSPAGRSGPGERHRRSDAERRPIGPGGPGTTTLRTGGPSTPPAGDKKGPGAGGPLRFTPEQLQALREGRSVTDVLRKPAGPGVVGQAPAGGEEELDEEGKKKTGPGKVVGRDVRHADRAKRQEQRKVRQKDVVIQGGQVEVMEEAHGSKRGRRASLLKKRMRLPGTIERKGKVQITLPITVRSLSEAIGMKVAELLFKLKDLTQSLYTINSNIDTEVAELIATEKGVEFEIVRPKSAEEDLRNIHEEEAADESKLELRAPVVAVMGHVDHGKTSLLDRIRKSNVVDTEAGGITQVIRAWRVMHNGKPITFLDTPGHEAFTKMRARGANVTDVAVIVVAANDGVMPQTEEAISHAKAAGVSIVVAINKVDMPDANVRRTEQQLYGMGLIPDTMGGDVQFVQTSATKGTGIDELLDTLALVAEVKELKANPHKPAMGTCLEAYLSGDEGVMATLLVQQGTLRKGDVVLCGAAHGRVRAMYDDAGRSIDKAGPSIPVRITGLDEVPNADDHFHVVAELGKAREIAEKRKSRAHESQFRPREAIKLEKLGGVKTKIAELKVVLKAEARGSVEAIRKELEKLVHEEVRVRVLHAGIGAITESDVQLALASPDDTIVVGFNVVPDDQALRLGEARGIPIREYNIIYKLTDDIRAALEGKLKPREEVIHLGRAVVRETFKVSRVGTIAGCYVTQGVIERAAKVRVIREGAVVYPPPEKVASLESLKRFKDDAKEVREGFECGMKVAGYDDVKVGDVIEAYRVEQVQRTLLDK